MKKPVILLTARGHTHYYSRVFADNDSYFDYIRAGGGLPVLGMAASREEAKMFAQKLAHDMRLQGFRVMSDIAERNVKGQFKYADRVKARYTVVIGEEEISSGELTLKHMESGDQKKIRLADLTAVLQENR